MDADERLSQFEPLLSGALRTLDQHTNQLNLLAAAVSEQSSNIIFVLSEQAEIRTRLGGVDARLESMNTRLEGVDARLGGAHTKLDEMGVRLRIVETNITGLSMRFMTVANEQAEMKIQLGGVVNEQAEMKIQLGGVTGKLDYIIQLLQKPGQ